MKSMLNVDFRRMFTMRLLYIMLGICLVTPILILVMTSGFGGDGEQMFSSVWPIIGTTGSSTGGMDIMAMCNIDLVYFGVVILACLFVSEDFKSGYAKNLFTVRAKKTHYVISKILVCFAGGALMIAAFFVGAMLDGVFAGLPFELGAVNTGNIVLCMLSKIFVVGIFVAIPVAASAFAKQKTWAAILGACIVCTFLFPMVPMMTPLNATAINASLCLVGGLLLCIGLGSVGSMFLKKRDIL